MEKFLPCYLQIHTYPPLLYEHKPLDYPCAGPSVQLDQEWGRWPAHYFKTSRNNLLNFCKRAETQYIQEPFSRSGKLKLSVITIKRNII